MRLFIVTLLMGAMAFPLIASGETTEDDVVTDSATQGVALTGEVAAEVNFGHASDVSPHHIWDVPHITAAGTLEMPRGWSVVAELEYERFQELGVWGNNFRDNYTTNLLYVNKQWSPALNVKAGIIDVPVGVTNSRGSALTIYDPLSEAAMLPITWHEGGVALWGQLGRWHYELGGLMFSDFTARGTRAIGMDARSEYWFVDRGDDYAKVAVSGYWGTTGRGNISLDHPDFIGNDGILVGAFDWDVCLNGFITDGSFIKTSDANVWSMGAEVGYNVLQRTSQKVAAIPFARYDGQYDSDLGNFLTLGVNVELPFGFILKGQHAWYLHPDEHSERRWDISLGYTLAL